MRLDRGQGSQNARVKLITIFDRLSRHLGFSNLARLISRVSNLGLLWISMDVTGVQPLSCKITGGSAPIIFQVKPKTWRILTFADGISITTGPKISEELPLTNRDPRI